MPHSLQSTQAQPDASCAASAIRVPTFVISLDRAVNRRNYMQAMLGSIGVAPEYVSAVDGKTLTAAQRAIYDPKAAHRVYGCEMTDSEIGCCHSHLSILRRMVRENIPCALILEDDIFCGPDFVSVVNELTAQRNPEWTVVRLQTLKQSIAKPRSGRATGRKVADLASSSVYLIGQGVLGAGAYLVRRDAAEAILKQAQTLYMPFDQMLDRFWENGIAPYVVRPFPAWENQLGSEIGTRGRALQREVGLLAVLRRRTQRGLDSLAKRRVWKRLQKG